MRLSTLLASEHLNRVVLEVTHDHFVVSSHRNARDPAELAAVGALVPKRPDVTAIRSADLDATVATVPDQDETASVDGHALRMHELALEGSLLAEREEVLAVGGEHVDAVAAEVAHHDALAVLGHRDARRLLEHASRTVEGVLRLGVGSDVAKKNALVVQDLWYGSKHCWCAYVGSRLPCCL